MHLTSQEKRAFVRAGLLVRRAAVDAEHVTKARELIDDWCREKMDPALIDRYTQRTFAPELGDHPDILALFTRPAVAELVGDLVGDYQPISSVQIQIRVPDDLLTAPQPVKSMHVDGVACPHLDPDELRTFTLLVGVLLSDVTDPGAGALRYQPGGHLTMSQWFRERWSLGITEQVPPEIDAKAGTPLLGTAGDLLLMHHLVPHAVGGNTTRQPRVMAYFRVSHVLHASRRVQALRNPWLDYPSLSPFLQDRASTD